VGTSRLIYGRQQSEASGYPKIEVEESKVRVSSFFSPSDGPGNLVMPGTHGFWHTQVPKKENPTWVILELAAPEALGELRLRPRASYTEQLWDGNRAVLHASNDGQTWTPLATLGIDRITVEDDWISFPVFTVQPYRFYRLSFYDPTFFSLSRIELSKVPSATSPTGQTATPPIAGTRGPVVNGVQQFDLSPYTLIPLESGQLEVSSINSPTQGKEVLVRPGTDGFWHVKIPRAENPAWVMVDLDEKTPVSLLRIRHREGVPDNIWDGPRAVLEASDDKQNWTALATLSLDRRSLKEDWTYFTLPSTQQYRYFRLAIDDMGFFSMARLELYQKK